MADNENARWLLRLPADWNGRLVMGVPAGTRSEYAGDWAHSDYLVQKGYAYVATNKGHLNSRPGSLDDPKSCHQSPPGVATSNVLLRLYESDSPDSIPGWFTRTLEGVEIAKDLAVVNYGAAPSRTYLVGISAGGLVVRRLLEVASDVFDGGIAWESPSATRNPLNDGLLAEFPVGLRNFPDYAASSYSPASAGYQAMLAFGFPPDTFASNANPASPRGSYLETNYNAGWNVLQCGSVGSLDPTYATSAPPPESYANYNFLARLKRLDDDARALFWRMAQIIHTGSLAKPMISIHGTMDALALMAHARAYHDSVVAAGVADLHRLYEIQNGSHNDNNAAPPRNFIQIERIAPYFASAFERLVSWVESGKLPPRGQCIPRGGAIIDDPDSEGRPEHCVNLLE
jgi:pimeloyl-ACP methyl ester carboxylesterase